MPNFRTRFPRFSCFSTIFLCEWLHRSCFASGPLSQDSGGGCCSSTNADFLGESRHFGKKPSCKRSSKLGYWFSLCWISEELWLEVRASGLGKFLVDAGLDSLVLAVSVASPPASFPYTDEGVFSRTLLMTCFWSLSGYACTSTSVASDATGSEGFCTRFVAGDFGCEPTCNNSTFQSTQRRQRTTRRRWGCTRSALRASCGRDLSVSQRRRKVCQTVWP